MNQLLLLGSGASAFPGVTLAVGVAQIGDGEPGVVLEGVEGLLLLSSPVGVSPLIYLFHRLTLIQPAGNLRIISWFPI